MPPLQLSVASSATEYYSNSVHSLQDFDGTIAHFDQERANILNTWFLLKGTLQSCHLRRYNDPNIDNICFTPEQIFTKLIPLNTCKSPGPDSCHPRLLKKTAR